MFQTGYRRGSQQKHQHEGQSHDSAISTKVKNFLPALAFVFIAHGIRRNFAFHIFSAFHLFSRFIDLRLLARLFVLLTLSLVIRYISGSRSELHSGNRDLVVSVTAGGQAWKSLLPLDRRKHVFTKNCRQSLTREAGASCPEGG